MTTVAAILVFAFFAYAGFSLWTSAQTNETNNNVYYKRAETGLIRFGVANLMMRVEVYSFKQSDYTVDRLNLSTGVFGNEWFGPSTMIRLYNSREPTPLPLAEARARS